MGFRSNRGRQQGNQQGQPPYGQPQQPYGQPQQPQYGGPPPAPGYGQHQQWTQGGGPGPGGGPEYFGGHDPGYPNNPGHTNPYGVGEAPDHYDPGPDGYPPPVPVGPKLHWKDLLSGIVLHPGRTFWQMRDHPMWGPALLVTFLYGLLAVFGLDEAREEVLNATISSSIPWMLATGVAMTIFAVILGAVTHTLARQIGGTGIWAPTIGLSMLIVAITDAPRVLIAMFTGAEATIAQGLGWVTWIAAGALLTSMVSKSHDLPWPRALAASSIQLIALLLLIKLGTL